MNQDEKKYEVVGNIRIKKDKNYSKKKKSSTSIPLKIFIWFMFIAMLGSFVVPLTMYLYETIMGN